MVSGVFSLPLLDAQGSPRDFLAGDENAVVRVARGVVLKGDRDRLPLVLCGPSGTGKTLLAEGLAEAWREAQSAIKGPPEKPTRTEVLRLTGVDFARQYANACDTDSIGDFRDSLLRAGLILIDGIHPLATKERAAREFCFQLGQWLDQGIVVIVTSLVAPVDLPVANLASRLSAGLVLPLALPSLDTRRQMLASFARERSLHLSDELVEQLAECVPGVSHQQPSPRDLMAALMQLEARASLTGVAVNRSLVEALFRPTVAEQSIDFKRIITAVTKRFGVTADELRSSSRRQSLVRARGVAIVLARRWTEESLQSLGKQLGKRDHSTIHHALETTEQALAIDNELQQLVESLEQELNAAPTTKRRLKKRARVG